MAAITASSGLTSTVIPPHMEQEGVLRDVLLELDRERSKRVQLEAQLMCMHQEETETKEECDSVSLSSHIALKTELEGYQQLVEALTRERPAIAEALSRSTHQRICRTTTAALPLHAIRLLEIMPWDSKAQEYAYSVDEILEWQIYDKSGNWASKIRCFPENFRSLPLGQEEDSHQENSNIHSITRLLGTNNLWPFSGETRVFTNTGMTTRFQRGCPLAHGGEGETWQWIGEWRLKTELVKKSSQESMALDDVWSYGLDPWATISNYPLMVRHDTPSDVPVGTLRCKKWIRQRILLNYPKASEQSRHFLRLLAENASLTLSARASLDSA